MSELVEALPTITTGLLIGGETIDTADHFAVYDPARPDRITGYAAAATTAQATAAVDAADRAFPAWAALTPARRAELVLDGLSRIDGLKGELADLLVRENGKVAFEAGIEMDVFGGRGQVSAGLAPTLGHVDRFDPAPLTSEVHALPMGVITIIIPFNWPLAILAASLPYALIAGNTAIVKPPPSVPLTTVRTLQLVAEALPPGVLNVVTGSNEAVTPLLTDPRVAKIVFTGSTAGGKQIMATAATNLTPVTLELGGNDPAIILEDAEFDAAMLEQLSLATFLTTGQVCMAVKRVYVPRSRYAELVDGLTQAVDHHIIGPGSDPTVTMGPLNNANQKAVVESMLDEARAAGVEVRELGNYADAVAGSGGHFLRPALVLDPDPSLRIVGDEQFGPALPILPYDDIDVLVPQLNSEWSGLCSSVWGSDHDRLHQIATRLRTGTTWINKANAIACDDRVPFGGFRQSGIGREMGVDGLRAYTEPHAITW